MLLIITYLHQLAPYAKESVLYSYCDKWENIEINQRLTGKALELIIQPRPYRFIEKKILNKVDSCSDVLKD